MKLRREILRLAVPSILANITVPLVGMVDMAVVGHLEDVFSSAALIGGITVGSMLFDLLYWNFSFLRAGTGGLTAQAFGRGDAAAEAHYLRRALRIALLSGAALIALQWLVVRAAFLVVECSPEVRQLASQYFHIRIWAAPAALSLFAFKGWFIGMQDSVRPMAADLIVNGVNIVLSVVLGHYMGFAGVAVGTVAAQWSGWVYAALAVRRRYRFVFRKEPVQRQEDGRFFRLNRDLFIRSLGLLAVYIGFTVISARHGDVLLSSAAIMMKLLMLFSYFSDGFAYAGEALTGRFLGEGSADGVRSTIRGCFRWGGGFALGFFALYGLGGMLLLRLFTDDPEVLTSSRQFLPWLMLMPVVGVPAFLWDGIFTGATRTGDMRTSVVLCAIGFFLTYLGLYWGLRPGDTGAIHLLMAAYFVHLVIRSLWLTVRWKVAPALPA